MGQVCSGSSEERPKSGLLDVPSTGDESLLSSDGGDQSALAPGGSGGGAASGGIGGGSSGSNLQAAGDPSSSSFNSEAEDTARRRQKEAAEAALADAERRKRRELWIVNGAARGMVAVRSTRGSTGYYDQGFAGLLAQHLEQTTSFPDRLPLVLPPAPASVGEASSSEAEGPETDGAEANNNNNNTTTNNSSNNNSNNNNNKTGTVYDRLAALPWERLDLFAADEASELQGREAAAAQSGDPHQLMDALAESLLEGPYTVIPGKQQLFAGVRPMVENLL
eukprot:CAMPEP_0172377216 /NCGR_PEP_ID=MMETSP1060-20121228/68787_1 /TAXON_ID=37318 /ORGANISM="Pseudo-nitzschia pungens, Strain cf. cingulata" /LENGTH=278 /DNA_ID=CAMNT_0013104887 /DNA_START=352 /DNA_END=1188 /DNA_ORIENTATION=+